MLRERDSTRASLDGMVAIVTGASSGIGAATARELGRRGAAVVLAARRERELEAQAQAVRVAGGEAAAIPTDVAAPNMDTAMTSHVRARLPQPELVATAIADLVTRPRREVVIPRRHYAIAWLEQALPVIADKAHRRRHWSPVKQEEGAVWTS